MSNITELLSSQFIPLFVINTLFLALLLRGIFFRFSPVRNSLFGFFMFGSGVFLVTHLLQGVEISMGFAFGLFAIFAMLRYRTESISIRNMSYLFLVIVISLLNGVSSLSALSLILVNSLLCALVAFGETNLFAPRIFSKSIRYENIHNIRPENHQVLIEDLKQRTGFDIQRIEVSNIDFLSDTANIKVFHYDTPYVADSVYESKNTSLKSETNG
jgi:thiol:disulfide interchange protein